MPRAAHQVLLAVAALCILATVTYPIHDPDLWQHLTVGREIWRTGSVPHTQVWTWPTYGAPDVLPSWLFRALLWPFYEVGGPDGIFVWRWITTLATFALLLLAARRMGATGVVPIVVLVWCALIWRGRSQARPETLVAILIAAQLLLLESRRAALDAGRRSRHAWGLVPIALVWANAHISYYLGFLISGAYLLDDLMRRRSRRPYVLMLAILAALAASFVNPFGWRALAQPFEYFFVWQREPIFQTIGELGPIVWSQNLTNGLPVFMALLAVGAALRWKHRGPDWAELLLLLVCLSQALSSQRFVGYLAIVAAPFLARDLSDWASRLRWPAALHAPRWRATVAAILCVLTIVPEMSRAGVGLGYGFVKNQFPKTACDWIEQHDVRGRAFNPFSWGGYLLWRFYPDSTRLPFMDIHQAGTPRIRYEYAFAGDDSLAWRSLDHRWRFDWVIMMRGTSSKVGILDFLDADTSYALAFVDDYSALYLRRNGRNATQAREHGFRLLPAGPRAIPGLGERAWNDSTLRRALQAEVTRSIRSSEWNGRAHALAANVALQDGSYHEAADHIQRAIEREAGEGFLHGRLGLAHLFGGQPDRALEAFDVEREANPDWVEYDLRRAQALQALGRLSEARVSYERALSRTETSDEARDSLEVLNVR